MPIPTIEELTTNGGEIKKREGGLGLVTYRLIEAHEARNYDGSYGGMYSSRTDEGREKIIEKSYIDGGKRRYSNFW